MLPSKLEYLFVLLTLAIAGVSLFPRQLAKLARQREFWFSYLIFILFSTVIDLVALRLGWWSFSPSETCGLELLGVPFEEYLLFTAFFALVTASWEAFGHELA